jgi:hypothetical protein
MAQINQDATLYAGNLISLRFENIYREDDGSVVLISDILNATWGMTPFEDEVTPVISKSLGSGITVPADGTVVVTLDEADTIGLSGEFSHELRLLDVAGVYSCARGKITLRYQISSNPV